MVYMYREWIIHVIERNHQRIMNQMHGEGSSAFDHFFRRIPFNYLGIVT
jgi:hypothetical protein